MIRNGLEPWHLILVLAVVVLMFGSKKLPELARGVGQSLRILKTELREPEQPLATQPQVEPGDSASPRSTGTSSPEGSADRP